MALSWIDREPGYFALRSEVARLAARARRHKGAVFLWALGAAALATLFAFRSPRRFTAQISVRVTEIVEFNLPRSQWTDRELRSYVTDVAFTNQVLLKVYQQHLKDIYNSPNNDKAITRLRDDLDVQVVRNRVAIEQQGVTGPRSAHVVMRFGAPTAETAMAVLKSLATPIMETSAKRRRDEAAQEIRRATLTLEYALRYQDDLRKQAMEAAGQQLRGTEGANAVKLLALNDAIGDGQRNIARLQAEKDVAERRQRSEKSRPGINFAIAQESIEAPLPLIPLLTVVAVLSFLFCLPLAGLVVGTFLPYIESLEDVRRLGIPTLGRLRNASQA
jgi:hypothetical protein